MAPNADQITVALTGAVHVAPYSEALVLPTTPTAALPAAFEELGYTTEDGVTFTATPEIEDINAWQKSTPVRRIVTARQAQASFSLEQWNRDTFALAFGGGIWTTIAGPPVTYRYDPPADNDSLAEYAMVIDFADGTRNGRAVILRGNITEAVETQLVRNAAAVLPITFGALTPDDEDRSWFYLSDDPAFTA